MPTNLTPAEIEFDEVLRITAAYQNQSERLREVLAEINRLQREVESLRRTVDDIRDVTTWRRG